MLSMCFRCRMMRLIWDNVNNVNVVVFEQLGTVDLGPYQGNFGMGYMNLASKFNEILEKDPRLDDDGQVMRFGNGY